MRFADPLYLLLLVVPAVWAWSDWRARRTVPPERIGFSGLAFLSDAPKTSRARWSWLPEVLRMLGLALLVAALARPQVPHEIREIRSKSRSIMLALDISSSMKAGDFKPSTGSWWRAGCSPTSAGSAGET
jgi:Ca-activated chloride channel family protein